MKEGVTLNQLADILPPSAPGVGWMLPVIAVAAILAAILVLIGLMNKRRTRHAESPPHQARRRLAALRDAWQAKQISDREAAYHLATLLRLGLGLPQLAPAWRPAAVEDSAAWLDTLTELHTLRYRNRAEASLSSRSFDRAEQWLAAAQHETE